MKLYLVRHAETQFNVEGRSQGSTDTPLTEDGLAQAKKLAVSLSQSNIQIVYTSPLTRAVQTASAIASMSGSELRLEPGLRELEQGELEGLTPQEMRAAHPEVLKLWVSNPSHCKLPGGECLADAQKRAWQAIERIDREHHGTAVVVVSHNLTILTILCKVLGLDLDNFRRFRQDITAKHVIEFGPGGPVLRGFNDTSHLTLPN